MHVISHTTLPRVLEKGRSRFAAAHQSLGFMPFELWVELIEPNAVAQLTPCDRDRVALVLAGHGDLRIDGGAQRFRAPCSLILSRDAECEVVNVGTEPMHLVLGIAGADAQAPVGPTTSS